MQEYDLIYVKLQGGRQIKRGYKDIMGQFGSDGYLYDFAKRSARDHMGSFGSDGYLYDFAKVNILTTLSLN